MITRKSVPRALFLCAFYLVIYSTACVRDFAITPLVAHHLSPLPAAFVEPLWKLVTWILPTYLYIRYILREEQVLPYLKLTTNIRRGVLWGILGSLALFVYFALPALIFRGASLHLQLSFDDWLNGVALVGVLEEVPFRGVILQQLMEWMSFWKASALTTVLFVLIHVPLWISTGVHPFPDMLRSALAIGLISLICCYVFRRSGSLWSSIIAHSVNDLFLVVL